MVADIPETTDESRCKESAPLWPRRWLWHPWTLILLLVCLIVAGVLLEIRALRFEATIAQRINSRGHYVVFGAGWPRRMLGSRWRPEQRLFGDRIKLLGFNVLREADRGSLDDLVADLPRLNLLRVIHIQCSGWAIADGLTTANQVQDDLNRLIKSESVALSQLSALQEVDFLNLREGVSATQFLSGLRELPVTKIGFATSTVSDIDLEELARLSKLRSLDFFRCDISKKDLHSFKIKRPDVVVVEH